VSLSFLAGTGDHGAVSGAGSDARGARWLWTKPKKVLNSWLTDNLLRNMWKRTKIDRIYVGCLNREDNQFACSGSRTLTHKLNLMSALNYKFTSPNATLSRAQRPAARSKARTVFARSNTGVVASNPTQGVDVCMRLFCVCAVLCVGRGLETGWSTFQGVLPTVYRIMKLKTPDIEPLTNE
jgi:hypothetical protein